MSANPHTWSIASLVLGVLGSLLLSYDLIGKPKGPVRMLIVGAVSAGLTAALLTFVQSFAGQGTPTRIHTGISFLDEGPVLGFAQFYADHDVAIYAAFSFVVGAGITAFFDTKYLTQDQGPAELIEPKDSDSEQPTEHATEAPNRKSPEEVDGNLYYHATSQWDFSTGWGTPVADKLVAELLSLPPA